MIRLGLHLTLRGGTEAAVRLVVTAASVAVGVAMLLLTLAGINGVHSQNDRYGWLNAGYANQPTRADVDPVWWQLSPDTYRGQTIGRVDVAATGPRTPLPPGITRLPGPGQYLASPAMARLLRVTPEAELGNRYGAAVAAAGVIGTAGLPAPNSLIIVVGHRVAELADGPHASKITGFGPVAPGGCGCYELGVNADGLILILGVVAAAMLFPVLIFVGSATRLSAARREQRFAALRLAGATPSQVATIAAVESAVAAVAGVIIGFLLFAVLRAPAAAIPFTGASFFVGDLRLTWIDVLLVVVAVPCASVIAARVALRRALVSPLGVSRRVTPRPPRATRVVPLLAGLAELAYFAILGRPSSTNGQITAYLSGILVTMVGLLRAGPWVTMQAVRLVARRTGRPDVLLAGRRMADNPKATFRAVSGLILAVFVTTVAIAIISTVVHQTAHPHGGTIASDTIVDDFSGTDVTGHRPHYPATLTRELRAVAGVVGVVSVRAEPGPRSSVGQAPASGVAICAELATVPILGRCPAGAVTALVDVDLFGPDLGPDTAQARTVWPRATFTSARADSLAVQTVVVTTNGSRPAVESVKTLLDRAFPFQAFPPDTLDQNQVRQSQQLAAYQQLANVVVLAGLPIAGCSLAVSVTAGLIDRRRPFGLLRLAGTPLSVLRRVVVLESAAPLLAGTVVAVVAGFIAAGLFLKAQLHYSLQSPLASYYLVVLLGLAASLGVVASTLPLLGRITGPEATRND